MSAPAPDDPLPPDGPEPTPSFEPPASSGPHAEGYTSPGANPGPPRVDDAAPDAETVRELIASVIEASSLSPEAAGAAPDAPREPAAAEILAEAAEADGAPASPSPEAGEDGRPAAEAQPSRVGGMGAVAHAAGVTFRVWAPNADAVSVAGTFNGWSDAASPLARDGDGGYWSADLPGAKPGDEYRFVIRSGAQTLWKIDPYAREVTSSVGNGIVVDPAFDWGHAEWRTPPWNELVIYEVHVGTFNDRPGGHPGSFDGVAARLPYLADLGVSCIELMPSLEFATDFSWGYNPSHIFAIESAYGGPGKLKRLVKAAHEHGIAVVFDVVYNHFGPSDNNLWQFDGWSGNGHGGIYFYNDDRRHTEWGETRPDYGRPEVRQFLADNARMWLEEFRLDGLRWDATAAIRRVDRGPEVGRDVPDGWRLLQRITGDTDRRQPWKVHIAEDLQGDPWVTRPADQGGAGFDAQWDARFVHPVRHALTEVRDEWRSMESVAEAVAHRYGDAAFARVVYTESHDEVANGKQRLPEAISPGAADSWFARKRSTLGAALVFTSPGIPMIFQGQELLEDRWFDDGVPIDWDRLERFPGIHALYRDLARLRRNWHDTTRGLRGPGVRVHHVNDSDKVIAFHRWENGGPRDDVVVVANFGSRAYPAYEVGFPRAGEWKVRFNGDAAVYGPGFGAQDSFDVRADGPARDGMPAGGSVGIGPYTAVILSQDG
jgi:1,4-alpha-glucan branching enzyme